MSNYFIGAYLEIECNKKTTVRKYWACPYWHDKYYGNPRANYCHECGREIAIRELTEWEFPTMIVDDILPDKWENKLQDITPRKMYGTGRMLATWNGSPDVGVYAWLHPNHDRDPGVTEIPTADDIERIKAEFSEGYKDIISALAESPLVRSMEVKFGIVKKEEY